MNPSVTSSQDSEARSDRLMMDVARTMNSSRLFSGTDLNTSTLGKAAWGYLKSKAKLALRRASPDSCGPLVSSSSIQCFTASGYRTREENLSPPLATSRPFSREGKAALHSVGRP